MLDMVDLRKRETPMAPVSNNGVGIRGKGVVDLRQTVTSEIGTGTDDSLREKSVGVTQV